MTGEQLQHGYIRRTSNRFVNITQMPSFMQALDALTTEDKIMKQGYTEVFLNEVISMAWADEISFDKIKKETGLTEAEVIKIMRSQLKPSSFKLWRKRVSGRCAKHEKKATLDLEHSNLTVSDQHANYDE